jgi:uncharacterized protein (DUF362 family)
MLPTGVKGMDATPSRRELLAAAAAAGAGLLTSTGLGQSSPASPRPWWMSTASRSKVVEGASKEVLQSGQVNIHRLGILLRESVRKLTGAATDADAWRSILGDAQNVVLKFNSVGAELVSTNGAVARSLVELLEEAGYSPQQICLVEVGSGLAAELGARTPAHAWGQAIRVGGHDMPLARYLLDSDAVVSIGTLKAHHIAKMSASMINLSHAVIRHPARCHANHCSPAVAEVIGSAPVSSRLKLSIVNALRTIPTSGASAANYVVENRAILMGFDPVAVDAEAAEMLKRQRRALGLAGELDVPYLLAAHQLEVGREEMALRDVERVGV